MVTLSSCLWFDSQAEDAANYYAKVFKNVKKGHSARYSEASAKASGQKAGSTMTVEFEIEGQKIMGLNGGPHFQFSPALSYFVCCQSEEEINSLWQKLSEGGKPRMGLDKYPWSERYGWTADKFGVEWQLILAPPTYKIATSLLFANENFGKGDEALKFYSSLFPDSKVEMISKDEKNKTIAFCHFKLAGTDFTMMEGEGTHDWKVTPAFSTVITCDTQEEIDRFWSGLTAGGGSPGQCGWLTDKYGFSWQVVPKILGELASDPKKSAPVMAALMQMTKLDIKKLQEAAAKA